MVTKDDDLFKIGRLFLGPYQFLAISLISAEIILWKWMSILVTSSTERIVAGSLHLVVLISILVIFCVVYRIKRKYDAEKVVEALKSRRRFIIGPFQFLAISLISSEIILWKWMSLSEITDFTERIIAGTFFIAVLIAVLVVFCIIYLMKKKGGDDF